jgi:hypothetical protein
MKRPDSRLKSESEECKREPGRILSVLLRITWVAYLVVISSSLFWGDWVFFHQ